MKIKVIGIGCGSHFSVMDPHKPLGKYVKNSFDNSIVLANMMVRKSKDTDQIEKFVLSMGKLTTNDIDEVEKLFKEKRTLFEPGNSITDGDVFDIDVEPSNTTKYLKTKIKELTMIPRERQRLVFAGKILDDDKTVEEYRITDGSKLHLILALRGGMYHVSSGRSDDDIYSGGIMRLNVMIKNGKSKSLSFVQRALTPTEILNVYFNKKRSIHEMDKERLREFIARKRRKLEEIKSKNTDDDDNNSN